MLDHRPDLADEVLVGRLPLDNAYQQAKAAKDESEEHADILAHLPDDLAALVESGVRDIDDALSEVEDRDTVSEIDGIAALDRRSRRAGVEMPLGTVSNPSNNAPAERPRSRSHA